MPGYVGDAPELHVAAGVLEDDSGRVLVARRPAATHMAGALEFPGGKIAMGETPLQGLVRELREELDIAVGYVRFLTTYSHDYPERRVRLYVWKILDWRGVPRGAEGQPLQWLPPASLMAAGLLPADERIVACLQQPSKVNQLGFLTLAPNF